MTKLKLKSVNLNIRLKIILLNNKATLPRYAHAGDAGFDLFSTEDYTLAPGERHLFPLGFAFELPPRYFLSIRDKSGLAAQHGLHVLGGVIDGNYRGEVHIILINLSSQPYHISTGDKIAQGIIELAPFAKITEVKSLSSTARGAAGFGSTGKK